MLMEDRICKLVLRGIFSFSFVVFLIVVFPIFLLMPDFRNNFSYVKGYFESSRTS